MYKIFIVAANIMLAQAGVGQAYNNFAPPQPMINQNHEQHVNFYSDDEIKTMYLANFGAKRLNDLQKFMQEQASNFIQQHASEISRSDHDNIIKEFLVFGMLDEISSHNNNPNIQNAKDLTRLTLNVIEASIRKDGLESLSDSDRQKIHSYRLKYQANPTDRSSSITRLVTAAKRGGVQEKQMSFDDRALFQKLMNKAKLSRNEVNRLESLALRIQKNPDQYTATSDYQLYVLWKKNYPKKENFFNRVINKFRGSAKKPNEVEISSPSNFRQGPSFEEYSRQFAPPQQQQYHNQHQPTTQWQSARPSNNPYSEDYTRQPSNTQQQQFQHQPTTQWHYARPNNGGF